MYMENIMASKTYYELIKQSLQGNKYLENGEINPLYNPRWGLEYGRAKMRAEQYVKRAERFIEGSTTENPLDFITYGITSGKSQYQFTSLKQELIKEYKIDADTAEERSVVVSRLSNFLDENINKVVDGIDLYDLTQAYLEGRISRQEYFDKIKQYQENDKARQFKAY